MRVLLVSDIHANLVALDAVLRHAETTAAIDAVWNMGDCVGYGPQPCECIWRLQKLEALWVAGNHERAATGAIGSEEFNPHAAAAIIWTGEKLSPEEKSFLDALPEVLPAGGGGGETEPSGPGAVDGGLQPASTLVHGTLRWPIWEYLYSYEAARAHLALQETPVSFIGHTHIPTLVIEDQASPMGCEMYRLTDGQTVRLTRERKQVINPGSVGQPRDGDRRAACAVYDTEEETVTLHRVEYDIPSVQKMMATAQLPRPLIERLALGR